MRFFALTSICLLLSGCFFGGPDKLPLNDAERCADNGLVLSSTKNAQASGVVGSAFAGGGATQSCSRPETQRDFCEVDAFRQSGLVKRTRPGTDDTMFAASNTYQQVLNECLAKHGLHPHKQPAPAGAPEAPVAPAPAAGVQPAAGAR